jgi:hypothetical protein
MIRAFESAKRRERNALQPVLKRRAAIDAEVADKTISLCELELARLDATPEERARYH